MNLRIAILGPTCSGKSAIALELAEQINADIISCDSMQVYRGMDIGTAKPHLHERHKIRHHLVDILDISQPFNVSKFIDLSQKVLHSAAASKKPIVLVGGTGLYAKALIYQYQLSRTDANLYSNLYQQAQTIRGYFSLYRELLYENPFPIINGIQMNLRRLVRAVEVLRMSSGKRINCELRKNVLPFLDWFQIILIPDRKQHGHAIRRRIDSMINNGWFEETRKLVEAGLNHTPTARQALGYMEIAEYLSGRRKYQCNELQSLLQQKTTQYAKRQITWFKHQHPGAVFLSGMSPEKNREWICRQVINFSGQ